jgi:hypothetical protein
MVEVGKYHVDAFVFYTKEIFHGNFDVVKCDTGGTPSQYSLPVANGFSWGEVSLLRGPCCS